ncbi:hypothetical protein HK103_002356 [Boothiomyces macroporosus]|uniref:Uncharacterized protein n=1 Tax=Boothiomyces macroporosus TaxID=261099 RepID=A0AAD5UJ15_9FUNG|nr:hypothetical protein HK103_002356 [Boothiomyces macroporosus]
MSLVFQTGWYTQFDCLGAPDTIIIFNDTFPTPVYQNTSWYEVIPVCGANPGEVPIGCCLSSLDLSLTVNYKSISRNYFPDYNFVQSTPTDAVSNTYCHFTTKAQDIYIKQNNQCLENYKCGTELTVYSDNTCSVVTDVLPFNALTNTSMGLVNATLYKFTQGEMTINWIAYIPPTLLIPNYSEKWEYVQLIVFVLSLLFLGLISIKQLAEVYKTRKPRQISMFLYGLLLLFKMIYTVYFDYNIFNDFNWLGISQYTLLLLDLTSLFSCIISSLILFEIFKPNYYIKLASIFGLVVLHLGLELPSYLVYLTIIVDIPALGSADLFNISTPLRSSWRIFAMLFELLPPLTLYYMIYFRTSAKKRLSPKLSSILVGQIITILLNLIINFNGASFCHTDRQVLAIGGVADSCFIVNSALVNVLYQELAWFVQSMVNPKVETTPKKVMLLDVVKKGNESGNKTATDQTVLLKK